MGNTYSSYGAYTDEEKALVDVRLAQGHTYDDIVNELESSRRERRSSIGRRRLTERQLLSPRTPIDRSRTCGRVNVTSLGNAYTKRELVNLAVRNGYTKSQVQRMQKDELCNLLLSMSQDPFSKLPVDVSRRIYSELYA